MAAPEDIAPVDPRQLALAPPPRRQRCFLTLVGVDEMPVGAPRPLVPRLPSKVRPRRQRVSSDQLALAGDWLIGQKLKPRSLFNGRPLTRAEREFAPQVDPILDEWADVRPRTRADCANVPRPCPFVRCEFNLFLSVNSNGAIKLHHGHTDATAVRPDESCALDIADRSAAKGGMTLEETSQVSGVGVDRLRQMERAIKQKLLRVVKRGDFFE